MGDMVLGVPIPSLVENPQQYTCLGKRIPEDLLPNVLGVVGWICPRFGGGRVDVVPFWGWPSGCSPVLGCGGDRVDVSLCWGWTGGCVPVVEVAGWMCPCVGGDRVVTSIFRWRMTSPKNDYPKSLTLNHKPHPSCCVFQVWQGCLWIHSEGLSADW